MVDFKKRLGKKDAGKLLDPVARTPARPGVAECF
jgi:hypothetical protein